MHCVVPWAVLPALISCCPSSKCLSPSASHITAFSLAAQGLCAGSRKCCFPLIVHWVTWSIVAEVQRGRAADRGAHCCHCMIKCSKDLQLHSESSCRMEGYRRTREGEKVICTREWVEVQSSLTLSTWVFLPFWRSIRNDYAKVVGHGQTKQLNKTKVHLIKTAGQIKQPPLYIFALRH